MIADERTALALSRAVALLLVYALGRLAEAAPVLLVQRYLEVAVLVDYTFCSAAGSKAMNKE